VISQVRHLLDARKVGGDGLRAEKTKIHKIRVLGSQMVRAGKKVSGRENRNRIAEGIHRFRFGYVVGKTGGFALGVLYKAYSDPRENKDGFSEGGPPKVTEGWSHAALSNAS